MSTLILDRANLAMRQEGTALALYENGARRGTVPVKLLERVVVQGSSFEFTSGALLRHLREARRDCPAIDLMKKGLSRPGIRQASLADRPSDRPEHRPARGHRTVAP